MSTTLMNIGKSNEDLAFRYKMPKLQTKVEGRGNGIKTVLVNMVEVAKALKIHPAYPTKFFGIELGAHSQFEVESERALVNGNHSGPDLQKLLDKFIATFILCPRCKLPEVSMEVQTSKINIDCAACGYNSQLKTANKLTTYIIKNPPNTLAGGGVETSAKKDKKDEKDKKKKGKKKTTKKDGVDSDSDNVNDKESGADKQDQNGATSDNGKSKSNKTRTNQDDDAQPVTKKKTDDRVEWFTDTSKEAQRARQEAEFAEMKHVDETVKKMAADANSSAAQVLRSYVTCNKRSVEEIWSEIRRIQLSRGLDEQQRFVTALEGLLDTNSPKTVSTELKNYAPLLKKMNANTDKNTAKIVIGAVEHLVANVQPKLIAFIPHIFQTLYETDVLDEDAIIQWAESPAESSWLVNNKELALSIRKKAKPFIDWLKTAPEDGHEDDDHEDD